MNARSLTLATALLPLTACFEVIIPVEPPEEPAELQEGEWIFDMEVVAAEGDCWAIGMDGAAPDPEPAHDGDEGYGGDEPHDGDERHDDMEIEVETYAAWAFIETDGDAVSIDLEGFLLEGSIEGESLQAAGELTDTVVYDEPRQPHDSDEPEVDEEEGSSQSSAGCAVDSDDGEGVAPPCEPIEESITAFMDADIRSSTRMRGSIFVDYSFYDAYCTVEFAFEAEALEEDPCDCCDDDDDYGVEPHAGTVSTGSSGGCGR